MDEKIDLTKLAQQIISENQYTTIGTLSKENKVWLATVAYSFDKKYNFYFVSKPDSKHSIDIKKNKNCMITVYDSHQNFGDGIGLQIEGDCEKCGISEIPLALQIYFGRKWNFGGPSNFPILKKMISKKTFEFYKFTPTTFWMLDQNSDDEERVSVSIG